MQLDAILQRLVGLILEAGIGIGDKIPTEYELSERLSVSRPVIREALAALEAVGVVEARRGSGRILSSLDIGTLTTRLFSYFPASGKWVMDLLTVRQVMEVNMLQSAIPQLSDADIDAIEQLVRRMEEKARLGQYFGPEDRAFHIALYRRMNNDAMLMVLNMFWNMYDSVHTESVEHSQRLDETAAHHRRILDAIRASDIPRTQHFMNSHFYDTHFAIGSRLGLDAPAPPAARPNAPRWLRKAK